VLARQHLLGEEKSREEEEKRAKKTLLPFLSPVVLRGSPPCLYFAKGRKKSEKETNERKKKESSVRLQKKIAESDLGKKEKKKKEERTRKRPSGFFPLFLGLKLFALFHFVVVVNQIAGWYDTIRNTSNDVCCFHLYPFFQTKKRKWGSKHAGEVFPGHSVISKCGFGKFPFPKKGEGKKKTIFHIDQIVHETSFILVAPRTIAMGGKRNARKKRVKSKEEQIIPNMSAFRISSSKGWKEEKKGNMYISREPDAQSIRDCIGHRPV